MPTKAHTGLFEDAAYDLFIPSVLDKAIVIAPGERKLVGTGIKAIIPQDYWVKFHERSGLANKNGIQVMAGVIDSPYTGEWKVILLNTSSSSFQLIPGQAVCQFTLERVRPMSFVEISYGDFLAEEDKRSRKDKGFGSTDTANATTTV